MDKGTDSQWDAMWGRVDVRAGSQWGTTRNGRGEVAVVVGGTRLLDKRRCYWITVRKRGMVMWGDV